MPVLLSFAVPTDDPVTLWVNKVGPYNNPQEIYNFYSLPFCHPSGNPAHKWGGLGEVLGGNELIDSQIDIMFQKNVEKSVICQLELDDAKVKQFKDAIENSSWFEIFVGRHFLAPVDSVKFSTRILWGIWIKSNAEKQIGAKWSKKLLEKTHGFSVNLEWVLTIENLEGLKTHIEGIEKRLLRRVVEEKRKRLIGGGREEADRCLYASEPTMRDGEESRG
ncbi:hypothetical protein SLE2022_201800 [Rubroshorea leprosula]